jgi:uncharacterized membrane protein
MMISDRPAMRYRCRMTSTPHESLASRFDSVDALRGAAIVWMTLYHFCFDLNHFGYLKQNFYADPFWTWQRSAIVSLFLFTAGLGQAIAVHRGQSWQRFWWRWAQVAGCALLVSASSYWMYPKSFIYFGVLHGMAVMLLVVRLTASWCGWLWALGAAALAMQFIAAYVHATWAGAEFLNQNWFNWLGLISRKPVTEDYVPLVPWLGVMWWGMAASSWALRQRPQWFRQALGKNGAGAASRPLAWLGRWSLSYYMLHQPVLIGLFMALGALK